MSALSDRANAIDAFLILTLYKDAKNWATPFQENSDLAHEKLDKYFLFCARILRI